MENKKTLVIGASTNPVRYSNMAIHQLRAQKHEVLALAKRPGKVADVHIQTNFPFDNDIHTITMYLGAQHQMEYYDAILNLKPKRVIFNPGSENSELFSKLEENGIEFIKACTLLLLGTRQY
jgi:predicted CoA-binding protein